jgi:hypothetical protein
MSTAKSTANRPHRRATRKILVSAAIALAAGLAAAAPAAADPNAISTDANPFGTLGCNCPGTAPTGGPELAQEIHRGMREGLSVSVPGLPAPARPGQPRP